MEADIQPARLAMAPALNAKWLIHFQPQIQPSIRVFKKRPCRRGGQFKLVPEQPEQLKKQPVFVECRHVALARAVNIFATFPNELSSQIEL